MVCFNSACISPTITFNTGTAPEGVDDSARSGPTVTGFPRAPPFGSDLLQNGPNSLPNVLPNQGFCGLSCDEIERLSNKIGLLTVGHNELYDKIETIVSESH